MTYRPRPETKHWEAPPGVGPWRELTDDDYAALEERHGDLSRWYERVPSASTPATRKRRTTAEGDD